MVATQNIAHIRTWRLLILLAAVLLRLIALTNIPPGLTHDEADHGLSAWQVVQGDRPLYFTVGYGREPLYDYATAGLMSFLGPTTLALRLTSVFFSLIMLCATYAWVRRAFNERIALLTLAGLAVGFWPLMVGRHALRTITLPALFTLALALWWPHRRVNSEQWTVDSKQSPLQNYCPTNWLKIATAGLFLGLTFYTYMPARLLWLLFPGMLLWWWLVERPRFQRWWPATAVMLAIAVLVGLPLYNYLTTHPAAELRIGQLREPLDAAVAGDWSLLRENMVQGVKTISIAGAGDSAWRYNIAGRPLLNSFLAFFFYLGMGVALWRLWRALYDGQAAAASPYLFALAWLLVGLSPVLITGPYLSVTRAAGMMPVLFFFPALAIDFIWLAGLQRAKPVNYGTMATFAAVAIYAMAATEAAQSYFFDWAQNPEVRLQYETSLVTALDYVKQHELDHVTISSPTPDRFHSQPVGLLTLGDPAEALRWFNGQRSLLIPAADSATIIWSGLAQRSTALESYWSAAAAELVIELPLPQDDIDRPLFIYQVDGVAWQQAVMAQMETPAAVVGFGEAVTLHGFALHNDQFDDVLRVATLWEVQQPLTAEMVLFTQLLGPDGTPLVQIDQLDVPSNRWHSGDFFIQLHELTLPEDVPAGTFPLIVGFYDNATCPLCERLPVTVDGQVAADFYQLTTITLPVP